jgi:hypothetical protein
VHEVGFRRPTRSESVTGLFWLAAAACVFLHVLWPGDAPFINDEPSLLHNALNADREGRILTHGIEGTVGVLYGPVPIWFYQLALLLTHDAIAIVFVKSALFSVATLWGVLLLCRWVGAGRWLALAAAASPFLWLFDRILWDVVFQIPFSIWAVTAYLWFGRHRSWWRLLAFVLLVAALFGIHVMSMPTLAGLSLCLLRFDGRWLLREWRRTLPVAAAGAVLCAPYAWYVVRAVQFGHKERTSLLSALGAGLTSGGILSALGFHEYYVPMLPSNTGLLNGPLREALSLASAGLIAAVLAGAAIAAWSLRRRAARDEAADTARRAAALGLAIFGMALLMFAVVRREMHPHYYAGSLCGALLLLLLCGRALGRFLVARIALGLHLAVMALLLLDLQLAVHRNGGDLTPTYGPTLRNQVQVTGQVVRAVRGGVRKVVLTGPYGMFPIAFTTLFRLDPAWRGEPLVYRGEPGEGYVRLTLDGNAMGLGPGDGTRQIVVGMLPGPPVRMAALETPIPRRP